MQGHGGLPQQRSGGQMVGQGSTVGRFGLQFQPLGERKTPDFRRALCINKTLCTKQSEIRLMPSCMLASNVQKEVHGMKNGMDHTLETLGRACLYTGAYFFLLWFCLACSGPQALGAHVSGESRPDMRLWLVRDSASHWLAPDSLDPILDSVVRTWLGVPYLFGGESREGIDCSAFTRSIYAEAFGVLLPRRAAWQAMSGYAVPREFLRAGDLVFFAEPGAPEIDHAGMYVGKGLFVNSTSSRGVVYSSLDNPWWSERFRKAVRLYFPARESID